MRVKKCWYCKRRGRFGFKRKRKPWQGPECRSDRACFRRVRKHPPEGIR